MAGKAKDYDGGTRIADRRKEWGLTQDELADRIGIGRQALSAIENGGEFKVQTKVSLISEATNVLSNMSELQIQQCLAMMRALKNVQITD